VATGRPADPLGWVAGLVAAGLLLREVLGLLLPQEAYAVPVPFSLDRRLTDSGVVGLPGGGTLPGRVPAVLVLGVVVGVLAERVLVRSRLGKALRAVADDPDAAALCGVPARRVVAVAFVFAGVLAGVAGLLLAPGRALGVDDGVILGLQGAAAAFVGGLGSVRGALGAGLGVGLLGAFAAQAEPAYGEVAPLLLLVVVLAVHPQGLRQA
jgi:branched-subunit amino acid ABC-type transport system permease component